MEKRIMGLDVARAFAVFAMVLVNFKLVMGAKSGSEFLLWFCSLFEGRASALFVVLAGIGLTFATNKARLSEDKSLHRIIRVKVMGRGLLLLLSGLIFATIWPADILHFYGIYFMIAAIIFTLDNKRLLFFAILAMLTFVMLMNFFNYDQGWNWKDFEYKDFWSVSGMIRHLFFNGFHPVFPWVTFFIIGMWLGRQNLNDSHTRKKLFSFAAFVLVVIESSVFLLRKVMLQTPIEGLSSQDISLLFSTSMIPPFPQYMIAAAALATVLVLFFTVLADKYKSMKLIQWLAQTGQLTLTLYIAHIVIGMGILETLGLLTHQTIEMAIVSTAVFILCSIIFSVMWLKYFTLGPAEWLFKKILEKMTHLLIKAQ